MKDVVFLVADKDMEQSLIGLASRHKSFGLRQFTYDIFVHTQRDPGCCNESHHFLRGYAAQYHHALVIFDHQGCGREDTPAEELQLMLQNELEKNGWEDRARVLILQPELEIWVWSDSPKVDQILGWVDTTLPLRVWLREQGLLDEHQIKPHDPKKAVELALREVRKPRSAAVYKQLAEQVSVNRCIDPGFQRFQNILQEWFTA